jgi:hypothetical protein
MPPETDEPKSRIKLRIAERITDPDLYSQISQEVQDIDIAPLRTFYGPEISDEDVRKIETMMRYSFTVFQRSEKWAGADAYPSLPDCDVTQPLEQRLEKVTALGDVSAATNTAFANLEGVNAELQGHETASIKITDTSLLDEIRQKLQEENQCEIWDVGCGGQAADILILGQEQFKHSQNVKVTGVGARDYGRNIRPLFPEFADRLKYIEEPIYSGNFPSNVADLVFSGRTLPYTGVADVKRFALQLHNIAKHGGIVWCGSLEPTLFDFEGTQFKNLFDYLEHLKSEKGMTSIKYSNQSGSSILWNTAEGFPFEDFIGYQVNKDEKGYPGSIRYKLRSS